MTLYLSLASLSNLWSVSYQGSAKLEKAEILQMTVDHLKMLQATGGKGNHHMTENSFIL